MYKVVDKIPSNFDVNRNGKPIVTLEDEYGGQSVIFMDDHCFCLINGSEDREFKGAEHWYPEAAFALADYIKNNIEKDDSKSPIEQVSKWENER